MPSESSHQSQRRTNLTLLVELQQQAVYPDWVVTVAYYAALHSLDRYLARNAVHPRNHATRKAALAQAASALTQPVLNAYLDMEYASRIARYECVEIRPSDVAAQLQHLDLIERHLAALLNAER